MKKMLTALFLAAGLALPVAAQTSKTLVNVDDQGIALQGYDPVAFFTDGKPMKGTTQFVSKHDGAIYLFASKADKTAFDGQPEKYEPAFGGYCAYGVSRKKLVEIDVNAFQIMDQHLLLQYSQGVRDTFNKDPKGNLAKANANWPVLVEKKGK
jgi:YHS domain-containing protein